MGKPSINRKPWLTKSTLDIGSEMSDMLYSLFRFDFSIVTLPVYPCQIDKSNYFERT